MSNIAKGTEKRTAIFIIGLIVILITMTTIKTTLTNDDYFMIANWREVLKNGFYTTDPLSMHHTYRASVEKWLSCAALYYIYTYTGIAGLRITLTILVCLIAYLMYRLCFFTSNNKIMSLIFTLIMYVLGSGFFTIRPQTVTIVILLAETLCLEHYVKEQKINYLRILPILSWFEMQIHSTIWPCFFFVLIPYILDVELHEKKVRWNKKRTTPLMICGGVCFGTLFINPYSAWSVFYIFRSYNNPYMNYHIEELKAPTILSAMVVAWIILLTISMIFGDKQMPTRYWLLCFGFLLFALTAVRNGIFFNTIGLFPLCYMMRNKKISIKYNLIPCIPIVAVGMLLPVIISPVNPNEDADSCYVEIFDKLASVYGVHGENIFCDFNTGSYAEYIGYHPYIDSRAEVFSKKINGEEELWKEYNDLQNGTLYYKSFLNKYNFKYLIVDKTITPPLYTSLMHDDNYKVLFTYQSYAIFSPENMDA